MIFRKKDSAIAINLQAAKLFKNMATIMQQPLLLDVITNIILKRKILLMQRKLLRLTTLQDMKAILIMKMPKLTCCV